MIFDPLFLVLVVVAVTALGLSKGGFAGVGQIGTPLMALVMPPLEAAALLLPIMIVQDVVAVWVYRKDWSAWNLRVLIPGAIVGIVIAWVLAAYISDAMVRIALGAITIIFVFYTWYGKRVATEPRQPTAASGLFWGSISGFTSTLCQAGGPPFQMHILPQRLPKMTFVGTTAIFFGALNVLKIIPYFGLGQFSTAGLATSATLLPLAIVTNAFGIWLVRRTPQETFYKITMVLMLLISVELVRAGTMELLQ